ncbi:MAG: winged helix-turn-helix domain-containing protein, partial [Syntrophomonadaceae bacterium]|nr:winged helix-turn-helix domain-containing protein [Syntrophomonadaceae bacterium]
LCSISHSREATTAAMTGIMMEFRIGNWYRKCIQPWESSCTSILQQMKKPVFRLGEIEVDLNSGSVTSNKGQHTLTAKEFALLEKLYENRGNIVTGDSLCQAAWGDDLYGYENTLMVHIRRLRYSAGLQNRGLGLTIVRQIIKAHGGTTEFLNLPEGGCKVILCLPVS